MKLDRRVRMVLILAAGISAAGCPDSYNNGDGDDVGDVLQGGGDISLDFGVGNDGADAGDTAQDGDTWTAGSSEIQITPDALAFPALGIGVTSSQYLAISNVGTGTLVIDEISIESSSSEFSLQPVDFPIQLEYLQERVIQVDYLPADCLIDTGNLLIQSNDPDTATVEVLLLAQALAGRIGANPTPVDFGRVPVGSTKTVTARIENSGSCVLTVNDLFLTGSFDFYFTDSDGAVFVPDLPITIDGAGYEEIDITYHPEADGFDEATFIIRSDDAYTRTLEVPVTANTDQACIVVTGEDGIDFGARFISETHNKAVTITNCSQGQDLEVDAITLGVHGELVGQERFQLGNLPDLTSPLVLGPGETSSLTLSYSPILYTVATHPDLCTSDPCEVADGATLTITSNDEAKSPLVVDVRGVGTDNHCPVAIARARVRGDTVWNTLINTNPLAVLEFDGSQSDDSEGPIQSFQWEIADAPEDSVAIFEPSANVENPSFFLDLAGQYIFRLRVFDGEGDESCDSAEIFAFAEPTEAIHIQLVWETAEDLNRTDTGAGRGSDVDLHFLHPDGEWDNQDGNHGDCHWKDREPNWGDISSSSDNPSLDRDDTDGWGPEAISLDEPEGTEDDPFLYSVGVFYFSDHDYGPSDITVRIFIGGVQRFELTRVGLLDRQFVDVARIEWPSEEITRVDILYPAGFP